MPVPAFPTRLCSLYPLPLHSSVIPRPRSRRASRLRRSRRAGSTRPVVSRGARAPRDRVARRPAPSYFTSARDSRRRHLLSRRPVYLWPAPLMYLYSGIMPLLFSSVFLLIFLSASLAPRLRLRLRSAPVCASTSTSTTFSVLASVLPCSRARTHRSRGRLGPLVSLGDTSIASFTHTFLL